MWSPMRSSPKVRRDSAVLRIGLLPANCAMRRKRCIGSEDPTATRKPNHRLLLNARASASGQ
jgi:hypothetical protein